MHLCLASQTGSSRVLKLKSFIKARTWHGMQVSPGFTQLRVEKPKLGLGTHWCAAMDRLPFSLLLLIYPACECLGSLRGKLLYYHLFQPYLLLSFLHSCPVPGYPKGTWPWAVAVLPGFLTDLLFLRYFIVNFWYRCGLNLAALRKGLGVACKHLVG